MNKKIIISLSIIGVVAAIAIGGTIAYFNDTETSTGNIFTAGSLDLKVDHIAQTYNGEDCETCSLTLYSGDGGAQVVGGDNTVLTSFPFPAVLVTPTTITQQYWVTHPTARWIWASASTLVGDDGTNGDVTYTFEHKFNWWGGAVDVDLVFDVAADNQYEILLNGTSIATGIGSAQYTTLDPVAKSAFLAQVVPGENTLTFIVTNLTQDNPAYNTPLYNPGGLLYYLNVMRDSEDCNANSEFLQNCRLWTEKDLDGDDTFFNFSDVKPGDRGTNVISLHVDDNDAYTCLIIHNGDDQENLILDPEVEYGDLPNTGNSTGFGELSKYLNIFAWEDVNGNGVYEPGSENSLYSGPIQTQLIPLELTGGGPTEYIGIVWCAGEINVGGDVITCDGDEMKDDAQSDSFTASLTAYAEQQRNNEAFDCASVQLPVTP